jgi:ABC-2 type transport system permease protein
MRAYLTLTRRELAGYFLSLSGYVIIALTLFLVGLSFVALLQALQREPTAIPVTELFHVTWYFLFILMLPTPVITMRLFALEKFTGTFETLMTTPVRDVEVVLAKFSAAFLFYMVMWLPHLGSLWVVCHYSNNPAALEAGAIGSTFLGIVLLGSMFLSLGCLASALTRSQGLAAMIRLAFGLGLFLLAYLADQTPVRNNWQGQVLNCFALFEQMRDFARGVIDTRAVVIYGTITLFFLFLTLRIVESRRWK